MFSRRRSVKLAFNGRIIYAIFIVFALADAALPIGRVVVGDSDEEKFFIGSMTATSNEPNDMREQVLGEEEYLRGSKTMLEAMCHDFKYPVKTRLELTNLQIISQTDPAVTTRFRRDDKATVTHNGSAKDYMSIYYAQRKAIMEKYKAQQKKIMERMEKTKNFIAEIKKLRLSKKIDSSTNNATPGPSPDIAISNITDYRGDDDSAILSNATNGKGDDFNRTTNNPHPEVPISNSTEISNGTRETNSKITEPSSNTTDDEASSAADDYTSKTNLPKTTTLSPVEKTLRPFVKEITEIIDEPLDVPLDVQIAEGDWPSESINLIPQNEVDFNFTEQSSVNEELQEQDNDTVIFNLEGSRVANPSMKNHSAFDQLEEMFLWDVPAGDERISRSNKTDAAARQINHDPTVGNVNIISADDRSEISNQTSDSLRFMIEIKSSPDVRVTKNITNVQSSTTTYRNSTHEIVEINGVVNSTKRINGVPNVDLSRVNNMNFSNPDVSTPVAETGGGARESEWCEKCPHDYRWGSCNGTLFYQHNVFLRNRGPSAIDAIFGMNVQGPVKITCVEAIRFNHTRGIVTLHSGGPDHDFAKLRIRGFQGEGFSYIIKVWGVTIEEEFDDNTNYD